MNFHRYRLEKLLPILINRTVIFFFIMCMLVILLYAAGTYQNFIDSTQFTMLRLGIVFGIFLSITSLCGAFLNLGRFFGNRRIRHLLRAAFYILVIIFGAAVVLAAMFIITLTSGNA